MPGQAKRGPELGLAKHRNDYIAYFLRQKPQLFLGGSEVKASASNAGHPGSNPGSERSPEEGNGNPLQYSCLENPMDGEAL